MSLSQAIESSPYSAETAALLEDDVLKQKAGGSPYTHLVGKTLLQSYANSNTMKVEMIANILVLSLMRISTGDYLALSYILPGRLVNGPAANATIVFIAKCADLLERCKYTAFWAERNGAEGKALFDSFADFDKCIRGMACKSMNKIIRNIPKEHLLPMLGLTATDTEILKTLPLLNASTVSANVVEMESMELLNNKQPKNNDTLMSTGDIMSLVANLRSLAEV